MHYMAYQREGQNGVSEYIMVIYRGGGFTVKSVSMNSHSAILRDIAKLADGGYYEENDSYQRFVKDEKVHKIIG